VGFRLQCTRRQQRHLCIARTLSQKDPAALKGRSCECGGKNDVREASDAFAPQVEWTTASSRQGRTVLSAPQLCSLPCYCGSTDTPTDGENAMAPHFAGCAENIVSYHSNVAGPCYEATPDLSADLSSGLFEVAANLRKEESVALNAALPLFKVGRTWRQGSPRRAANGCCHRNGHAGEVTVLVRAAIDAGHKVSLRSSRLNRAAARRRTPGSAAGWPVGPAGRSSGRSRRRRGGRRS
jgi:hypothetical protein